jgi:hypothetical protein
MNSIPQDPDESRCSAGCAAREGAPIRNAKQRSNHPMKATLLIPTVLLLLLSTLNPQLSTCRAQSTAFTFQGRLTDKGAPATGAYDFRSVLYDAAQGGNVLGTTNELAAVPVTNGLFTVQLSFGDAAFVGGGMRWVELAVRANGSAAAHTTLQPRQPLTPTPMALWAGLAGTANAVAPGTIGSAALQNGAVTSAKIGWEGAPLGAALMSDGSGVVWGFPPSGPPGPAGPPGSADAWSRTGNAGTTPGVNFLGTTDNQPLELRVNGQRGLRLEPGNHGSVNVIGGWAGNSVGAGVAGATVAGGGASDYFGSAYTNQVDADFAAVAGGARNWIHADAYASAIGGGDRNTIESATLDAVIGGGGGNVIRSHAHGSTIAGGWVNSIEANADSASVGGGYLNQGWTNYATVGGGTRNVAAGFASTVSGGEKSRSLGDHSTVAGGTSNLVEAAGGTISGGWANTIRTNAWDAIIGGGYLNTIQTNADLAVVAGGHLNTVQVDADFATVGGGYSNTIQTNAQCATIGGGRGNSISSPFGTIAGGGYEYLFFSYPNTVTDEGGFVGGGADNHAGNDNGIQTDAEFATVAGGWGNNAAGKYATVPGGLSNAANGEASFAAGRRAKAYHPGAFVWGDNTDDDIGSSVWNQFVVRASGGAVFYSNASTTTGVRLPEGGTGWSAVSDRRVKENLHPVDSREILRRVTELPLSTWNLKSQDPSIRHLGPMAQDFQAAFGLGEDDRHINSVDADGVALAAIQGLNQKVEDRSQESGVRIQRLEAENADLKRRLERLEWLLEHTTPPVEGGAQ